MVNAGPIPQGDKVYLETQYVSVRWIAAGRWVHVEWKAWANSAEYRAAHETVLAALRENRSSKNLIDATHERVVTDDDQRWLIESWIPRAVAAGRRCTAVVMPKRALGKTITEGIDKMPRTDASKVEYFATFDEAAAWLSTVN